MRLFETAAIKHGTQPDIVAAFQFAYVGIVNQIILTVNGYLGFRLTIVIEDLENSLRIISGKLIIARLKVSEIYVVIFILT